METGQEFVKKIKPLGCAMFLGLAVIVMIICFTTKGTPLEGYEAPHDSDYYAEHLDELAEEITSVLAPLAGIDVTVKTEGERVVISGTESAINALRPYVLHYYDVELFEFRYT